MPHLSRPQRILLDFLDKYGCVRIGQVERLLRLQGCAGILNIEAITRQLVYTAKARRQDDYLLKQDGYPNINFIEALEIMLLLSPYGVEMHQPGNEPFSLTFFKLKCDKLLRYDICPVSRGREALINAYLEKINHKYRIIIFVLDALEQREWLTIECEHCFVIREGDGSYHFYKSSLVTSENL